MLQSRDYLISTHSFLFHVSFSDEWKIQQLDVLNTGYHFGIAVIDKNKKKDKASFYNGFPAFATYRGGDTVHDQTTPEIHIYEFINRNYTLVEIIKLGSGFSDVHQMAWNNSGLYIVNTGANSIVYRDLNGGRDQVYHFDGKTFDANHANSVFPNNGQIFVVLHNLGKKESQLLVLDHDLNTGFSLLHSLSLFESACHNVYSNGEILLYNSSRDHALTVIDLISDKILTKVSFKGWHTKGISVTSENIVVGLSEYTLRDRRSTSHGMLGVIEKRNLEVERLIDLNLPELPQPVGNVNEVRCISSPDFAHSSTNPIRINWSHLKFARKNLLAFWILRAKLKILLPLRKIRNRFLW